MFGMTEALIIGGVVILLFGGKKLPELGRSLGEGITNFKKGIKEADQEAPADQIAETKKAPAAEVDSEDQQNS